MTENDIYASLEIADHELRLVLGQFKNSRLYVLKVERVECSGILNQSIVDADNVTASLIKAVENINHNLGIPIKSLIVAIPAYDMQRLNQKVQIKVGGEIGLHHIQEGIRQALRSSIPEQLEVVNIVINKSIINGINLKRLPINEVCDSFILDCDLLCAEKSLVYTYASIVENAGLTIAEISLDNFAIGKEANLFDKSLNNFIVLVKIERQNTCLSLFAHGKLVSSEILNLGSQRLIEMLADKYKLPIHVADRLLHFNVRLGMALYPDTPIYLWSKDQKNYILTEREVAEVLDRPIQNYLDSIHQAILPIIEKGKVDLIVTGGSAEINGLAEMIGRKTNCETIVYTSDTLGVRKASLSCASGLFYVLKDQSKLRMYDAAFDMNQYTQLIKQQLAKGSTEDTLSGKLKDIFKRI